MLTVNLRAANEASPHRRGPHPAPKANTSLVLVVGRPVVLSVDAELPDVKGAACKLGGPFRASR